jgi:predicted phosphodiesterase
MKLAVLADIHANEQGMHAVVEHLQRWRPDRVLVAGDVINRGPLPRECLSFVLDQCKHADWTVAVGNHEEYVLRQARDHDATAEMRAVFQPSRWTLERIGELSRAVAEWPFSTGFFGPDGGEVRMAHASMQATRDGIFAQTSDDDLARMIMTPGTQGMPPALFVVGHTHIPLVRAHRKTLVVNVGAAGMPFDGDRRACYAQIEWHNRAWHVDIVRLAYDTARAERDFVDSGFLDEAGPLARIMLHELRIARGLLFEWTRDYEPAVLAGATRIGQSVDDFLRAKGLER